MIALTPPANTASHSPDQMLWQACEMATSADEQAVSTEALGPRKSNMYEMRLAAMLNVHPLLV